MARNCVQSIGFIFFIIHMSFATITLILSAMQIRQLVAVSVLAIASNLFWALVQMWEPSRWSGLQFSGTDSYRKYFPRWALSLSLAFFYFDGALSLSNAAHHHPAYVAETLFAFFAAFAYGAELFVSLAVQEKFDGQ